MHGKNGENTNLLKVPNYCTQLFDRAIAAQITKIMAELVCREQLLSFGVSVVTQNPNSQSL